MLTHLSELNVEKASLILVGQSIGCGPAIEMARRGYGQKLILLSPFTSLLALSQRIYPIFSPALKLLPFLLLDKFDNLAKAKELEGVKSLVIHGSQDEIVPYDMGKDLAAAIGSLYTVQGTVACVVWPLDMSFCGEDESCWFQVVGITTCWTVQRS